MALLVVRAFFPRTSEAISRLGYGLGHETRDLADELFGLGTVTGDPLAS
ncbi:hypothetical protein [Halomontanus rarus]|nr:hypothetical protein [Halovivax sp. TS33]